MEQHLALVIGRAPRQQQPVQGLGVRPPKLGFGIEQEGKQPRYLWQWGDNGGWKNFFLLHPESHTAIVTFTNGGNGMHVIERVMRAATGDEQVTFLWV